MYNLEKDKKTREQDKFQNLTSESKVLHSWHMHNIQAHAVFTICHAQYL